jgi:hypothetical protein
VSSTRAFVDEVAGAQARLIAEGHTFHLPAALLPDGAVEGTWVSIRIARTEPPPDDTGERRARMVRGDDGGDIKL